MQVLIIEDDFLIAKTLEHYLTEAGHAVAGMTASADHAIDVLNNRPCDAAIVDANLAGSSALPVATALELRRIPFVVVSGYSRRQLPPSLHEAPFLPKPVQPADLLKVLASFKS